MSNIERPDVPAATRVRFVEVINGGSTPAVRLHAAGGEETCVLMPMAAVGDLLSQRADALDVTLVQAS